MDQQQKDKQTERLEEFREKVNHKLRTDPSNALPLCEEFLAFAEETGKGCDEALLTIGIHYFLMSDYKTAKQNLTEALQLAEKGGNKALMRRIRGNLGNCYRFLGEFDGARKIYESLQDEITDDFPLGIRLANLYNLSEIHRLQNNLDKAFQYSQERVRLAEEDGNPEVLASVYHSHSIICRLLGDIDKESEFAIRAYEHSIPTGNQDLILKCFMRVVEGLAENGNYQEALSRGEELLALGKRFGTPSAIAGSLSTMGNVHSTMKDYERSAAYYQKALDLISLSDNRDSYITDSLHLAAAFIGMGRFLETLLRLRKVHTLLKRYPSKYHQSFFELYTGLALLRLGKIRHSETHLLHARYLFQDLKIPQQLIITLRNLAKVYKEKGDAGRAYDTMVEMLEVVEKVNLEERKKLKSRLYIQFETREKERQLQAMRTAKDELEEMLAARLDELQRQSRYIDRQRSLAEVGTRAASLTHKIKSPLTVLEGALYNLKKALEKERWDEDYLRGKHDEIARNVMRITDVVNLIDSHTQQRDDGQTERIDPGRILKDTVSWKTGDHGFHGIDIEVDTQDGVPPLEASAVDFMNTVFVLLDNARDAIRHQGRSDGKIRVSLEYGDGLVWVRVSDNGCGIGEDDRERMFDPYWSTKTGGTGLGLTQVQGFVRTLGGRVMVQSKPGAGTTISLAIPLHRQRMSGRAG